MGIQWRKNKNESNQPLSTLKSAYELLGIDKFPVTYDEVCKYFYLKTMDTELSQEQKNSYETAKEMILSKLSTNPFNQENSFKTDSYDPEIKIGLKKESILEKIKKKLLQIKGFKKVRETENQFTISENESDFILLKKKNRFGKNKSAIITIILIAGIVVLIFKGSIQSRDMYISKAESIQLLESQGVKLGNRTIDIKPENICSYTVKQKGYIPGIDICILERNYLLCTQSILTKISSLTAYKLDKSEVDTLLWDKVWESADDHIVEADLSGAWSGSFCIGDEELKDATLKFSMTENGYIEGIFSFKLANLIPGEIEITGKYDKSTNKFNIKGSNWLKRPSLFVTPSLNGYYDYQKEALVSSKDSSSIFEFKSTEANMSIFVPLLEEESASYLSNGKNHNIKLGKLCQFTYKIVNQTEESVEIVYTGVTNRDIVNFKVKGNAIFEKVDAFYILKGHSATAEYLSTSITGIYNGTEWVSDEEYKAVYEIYYSETDEMFLANVTLTRPFKKIEETRVISFENGGIKSKRLDVHSDKVEGDGESFALMNYEADQFCKEKDLILSKQIDTSNTLTIIPDR